MCELPHGVGLLLAVRSLRVGRLCIRYSGVCRIYDVLRSECHVCFLFACIMWYDRAGRVSIYKIIFRIIHTHIECHVSMFWSFGFCRSNGLI